MGEFSLPTPVQGTWRLDAFAPGFEQLCQGGAFGEERPSSIQREKDRKTSPTKFSFLGRLRSAPFFYAGARRAARKSGFYFGEESTVGFIAGRTRGNVLLDFVCDLAGFFCQKPENVNLWAALTGGVWKVF